MSDGARAFLELGLARLLARRVALVAEGRATPEGDARAALRARYTALSRGIRGLRAALRRV